MRMPLRMARFVYQDNPDLQKARAAFLRQDYPLSLRLFEKCAKRQPNNLMALTDAARAHNALLLQLRRHLPEAAGLNE